MGSAGFGHWPDFFDRLMECRRRGAALRMLDAFKQTEPVLVANRWAIIADDPAWEPLRAYLGELAWESFASIPMMARGQAVGVLNAFFAPGQPVEPRTVEFLSAMADQAAIAVDYATLLRHTRDGARRDEPQRLARDLHDSIVQQVFSISMQAKSFEVLGQRGDAVPAAAVQRIASEVGELSGTVLADLRAMVHELRLASSADLGGLEEAIRALSESTANRTGLTFRVFGGQGLDQVKGELAEDVYRIIAEAIHNVVRHAGAGKVTIRLGIRGDRLTATVADDGQGMGQVAPVAGQADAAAGYGLTTMRERAERWGGTVTVGPGRNSGTVVKLAVPLDDAIPLAPDRTAHGGPGGRAVSEVRVMIVDDHAVVRRGVRAYLEALDDMAVAAEAADGQDALDQLAKMAAHGSLPDVVLLDLVMPRMDGVRAASLIAGRHPAVRVVILTSFGEMERVHAALVGGAVGYLLKDAGPAEVATAIHAAAGVGTYLDPAIARRLTREISAPRSGLNALTERERAVLVLVAHGRSNREIADELVISERTARTHVSHVLRKLQLTSRTQAALVAVREGLVPPGTAPPRPPPRQGT
jgi:DNA-binding NarL/FixJ family response regulator/signal transduction histidine kinase